MINLIWATSYNAAIYNASAKYLRESFLKHNIPGTFVVGWEEYAGDFRCGFDVSKTDYRKAWLEENDDIVPPIPLCGCSDPYSKRDADHKGRKTPNNAWAPCHHTWWNRNAYRWHNKCATLVEIVKNIDKNDPDVILLWIDSDCRFLQPIETAWIDEVLFKGLYNFVFLRGNRHILEAGFFAIKGGKVIHSFVNDLQHYYKKPNLRKLHRWDDSFIIQHILYKRAQGQRRVHGKYIIHDIATEKENHGDVFRLSKIGQFINHDKGKHGRVQGIFL